MHFTTKKIKSDFYIYYLYREMGRKYLWGRKASLERRKWKIADYQREYYNRNRDKRLEYMKERKSKRWQEKKNKWNKYQREYRESRKEFFRQLEEENKKLKEENEELKAIIDHYKKFEEWKKRLEWMLKEED